MYRTATTGNYKYEVLKKTKPRTNKGKAWKKVGIVKANSAKVALIKARRTRAGVIKVKRLYD